MEPVVKLLFICTHNRCRSILCEAIASQRGAGSIQAASAGSAPVDAVHPLTLRYLEERGYQTSGLQSQSWEDLAAFNPIAWSLSVIAQLGRPARSGWVRSKNITGGCPTRPEQKAAPRLFAARSWR